MATEWCRAPGRLGEIAAAAHAAGRPASVHLKVDTGLSRAGATVADWPGLVTAAAKAEAEGVLRVIGVWSHFAYADAPQHPVTLAQLRVFTEALDVAATAGLRPQLRHIAQSAATLVAPDARYDLVRPGLAVYGLSPVPHLGTAVDFGLTPAMTLSARVALTKRVPTGSGVSYGHTYRTSAEAMLALVPLGYADGIPRRPATSTSDRLPARRVSGTVCM